jgi:hypothetical protein
VSVLRVSGPQLVRALRGGQLGNMNASKSLPWLDSYNLESVEGIQAFMVEAIRHIWTGQLGSRAAGALNSCLTLLIREGKPLADLEKRITELEKVREGSTG